MNIQNVCKWRTEYLAGQSQLYDKPHSGRLSENLKVKSIQQKCNLSEEDRRMSILEVCHHLQLPDCGRTSVGHIIKNVLRSQKFTSRWVPCLHTTDHKKDRLDAALQFVMEYHCEGPALLN